MYHVHTIDADYAAGAYDFGTFASTVAAISFCYGTFLMVYVLWMGVCGRSRTHGDDGPQTAARTSSTMLQDTEFAG